MRALKHYLNEINLICGRVKATISKFSPQIFETYYSLKGKHCQFHRSTFARALFVELSTVNPMYNVSEINF